MREMLNMDAVEYIALEITFFHKWGCKVRVYDTGLRMMERK